MIWGWYGLSCIWNCLWLSSSLLVSCTCLPSCEQTGYSSQNQSKKKKKKSFSHRIKSGDSVVYILCFAHTEKRNPQPGRNSPKHPKQIHAQAPNTRSTRLSLTGLKCASAQAENEDKMLDVGELRAPLCVCCVLPLSVQCERQMQSVWSISVPGSVRSFLHCFFQDQSDSSTIVRMMSPAGNKARLQKSDHQAEAAVVDHVQISWLALKDRYCWFLIHNKDLSLIFLRLLFMFKLVLKNNVKCH